MKLQMSNENSVRGYVIELTSIVNLVAFVQIKANCCRLWLERVEFHLGKI